MVINYCHYNPPSPSFSFHIFYTQFSFLSSQFKSHLVLGGPDGFEETLFGGQTAKRVVSFRSETNSTGEGESDRLASETAFSVNFTNVQLDGSVILGGDEAVSSRAGKKSLKVTIESCRQNVRVTRY